MIELLRLVEKKALRSTAGPERDEVTGGWRQFLHRGASLFLLFSNYY
jgi:hypothetical protein